MSDQTAQPRLRIRKVEVDTRRHTVSYHMSGGYQLLVWFVANLQRPGQPPLYLGVKAVWLLADGGNRFLGGIAQDPLATDMSDVCYFHSNSDAGLTQPELLRYLRAADAHIHKTWGERKKFGRNRNRKKKIIDLRWISPEPTLEGWGIFMDRLREGTVAALPAALVARTIPKLA